MSTERCGKCGEVERYILHAPLVNGACVRSFCDCRGDFGKHHAFAFVKPEAQAASGTGKAHPGCNYLAEIVCNKCGWVDPAAALDAALRDANEAERKIEWFEGKLSEAEGALGRKILEIADLQQKLADALRELFDCLVASGADTDGSDVRHLNPGEALASVKELHQDYRDSYNENADLQRRLDEAVRHLTNICVMPSHFGEFEDEINAFLAANRRKS